MKIKRFISLLLLLYINSIDTNAQDSIKQKLIDKKNQFHDGLVHLKRDLHQHPELSGKEKRTSKIVQDYLLDLGLEVRTDFGGYSVVGILKGSKEGKKIAWRADMDAALHVFGSNPNAKPKAAHVCGHDIHTTIGLGIANTLSKMKDRMIGTVYFIFQPAEETFKGAKSMIENGLFQEIHPDEIFGLHVFPTEVGTVSSKPNELFAYQRRIKLTFDTTIDQNAFRKFLKELLEGFIRHKANGEPWSLVDLNDPKYGLSNPKTIYNDYFILGSNISTRNGDNTISFECTYYETDSTRLDSISKTITNTILDSEYAKFYIKTSFTAERPTVLNDSKLTEESLTILKGLYGEEKVKTFYGQIPYSNEDFIFYQNEVPGVMFLLGGSNKEKGINALPHTSEFEVDEEVIPLGVNIFSNFLTKRIIINFDKS